MEDPGVLRSSPSFRRLVLAGALAAAALVCTQGCALYHRYEGYQGRVVDKETGKPIAGAGVFVKYYKKAPSVGGDVSYLVRATHALTDGNGEFRIPPKTVFNARYVFSCFEASPEFALYAPGYTVYPRHRDSLARVGDNTLKEPSSHQYMTVMLRRLRNMAEIKDNLIFADDIPEGDSESETYQTYLRLQAVDYKILSSGR